MSAKKQTGEAVRRPEERAAAKVVQRPRGKVFTRQAGIFKLIGIGDSGVPGGYSSRKHELTDCGQKHHLRHE